MQCGDLECNSERFTKSGASFATDLPALVLLPGMGKTMSNRSIRKSRSR
jgi:CRISPR/Cas system CMR-associated protein Cmr5 small subunit